MENYKWSFSIAMLNYQRVVVKQRKCWLNQQHNGVKKPIILINQSPQVSWSNEQEFGVINSEE